MEGVQETHQRSAARQKRAYDWALRVYGKIMKGRRYQAFRFLEEAMELAQTQGLTLEDMVRTAKYVDSRPVGDTKTEMGDVKLCLDIMAENLGLDADACHTSCLNRVDSLDPDKCRAKDAAKVEFGMI